MPTSPQWSGEFYQQALRVAKIGLWEWDLRGNHVTYSAEWKHLLGYAENEISNELHEWESRIHPDDLPKIRQRIAAYRSSPWPDFEEEFRIQRKDDSWIWTVARAELV